MADPYARMKAHMSKAGFIPAKDVVAESKKRYAESVKLAEASKKKQGEEKQPNPLPNWKKMFYEATYRTDQGLLRTRPHIEAGLREDLSDKSLAMMYARSSAWKDKYPSIWQLMDTEYHRRTLTRINATKTRKTHVSDTAKSSKRRSRKEQREIARMRQIMREDKKNGVGKWGKNHKFTPVRAAQRKWGKQ